MAITVGGGSGKTVTPSINVTPLVDVVLVLLIIFLVVTPLMTKTLWVHLPKQEKEEVTPEELKQDPEPPLLLRVESSDVIQVNGVTIGFDELPERLKRMFAARDDHILFFDADDGVDYGFAVSVLDQAREGGAVTIAPLTQALTRPSAEGGAAPAGGPDGQAAPEPQASQPN
jgi:biopolymer transport protein ExbD